MIVFKFNSGLAMWPNIHWKMDERTNQIKDLGGNNLQFRAQLRLNSLIDEFRYVVG